MNNIEANEAIQSCKTELQRIFHLIEGLGHMSPVVPFLTNYAIIKSCGTTEFCFKTIISDIHSGQSQQVINYVDTTIRNSSLNPSLDNICKTLKKFDENWLSKFKESIKNHANSERIKSSLESLNTARNSFAHGKTPSSSFENIQSYFNDAIEILEILDTVINE